MSESATKQAARVELSVQASVSPWVLDELSSDAYTGYLRRVHAGPVGVGDEWDEFVNRGCGLPKTVVLRVERVTGGSNLGRETAIDYTKRTPR